MGRLVNAVLLLLAVLLPSAPAAAAGPTCKGERATIVGTTGPDVLVGTAARDVVLALGGDDAIRGRGAADVICGGRGSDVLLGGAGDDALYGGWGGLRCFQHAAMIDGDRLAGGRGDDWISGGRDPRHDQSAPGCSDLLSDKHDVIDFSRARHGVLVDVGDGTARGQGQDAFTDVPWNVVGSSRADRIIGDDRLDGFNLVYSGGPGSDRIEGRVTGQMLLGGVGDDVVSSGQTDGAYLVGGPGSDELGGGPMDDVLRGNGGADLLTGGRGSDALMGGEDHDRAYGGGGRDRLDWSGLVDDVRGGPQGDVVLAGLSAELGPGTADGGQDRDLLFVGADRTHPTEPLASVVVELRLGTTEVSGRVFDTRSFANVQMFADADWLVWGTDEPNRVHHRSGVGTLEVHLRGGDDLVEATDSPDVLHGGAGTDTAKPRRGDDECFGFEVIVGRC